MFTKKTVMKTAPFAAMALAALLAGACSDDDVAGPPTVGESATDQSLAIGDVMDQATLQAVLVRLDPSGAAGSNGFDVAADTDDWVNDAQWSTDLSALTCPDETQNYDPTVPDDLPTTATWTATYPNCTSGGMDWNGAESDSMTGLGGLVSNAYAPVDEAVTLTGSAGVVGTNVATDRAQWSGGGTATVDYVAGDADNGTEIGSEWGANWTAGVADAVQWGNWNLSWTTDADGDRVVSGTGTMSDDVDGIINITITDLELDTSNTATCGDTLAAVTGTIELTNSTGTITAVLPSLGTPACNTATVTWADASATDDVVLW